MIFILKPFQFCFQINRKFQKETKNKKKVHNESIINGERREEAKTVEKSEDVAEKSADISRSNFELK